MTTSRVDRDYFEGSIHDFVIFSTQYGHSEIAELAGVDMTPPKMPGALYGTDGDDVLYASERSRVTSMAATETTSVHGTAGDDVLDGGHGEDWLEGGAGNDLLISRSDGREAQIAQAYGNE